MRSWPLLFAVALVCGCGAEDERSVAAPAPGSLTREGGPMPGSLTREQRPLAVPSSGTLTSEEHRFTAQVPDGWAVAPKSLTPNLLNPVEILSAGTALDSPATEGGCAQVAVAALEQLGPRDAFVTVQERYGEPRFPDRPQRFALTGRVEHGDAATCARDEQELEEYWFEFRDAGRGFHVLVAFGPDAPPERRAEALALLDSLRFEPGPQGVHLDPDAAVPHKDRAIGLAWQMPMPPWRRYDWSLTSVRGQRLVLGTFDLAREPPDRNCTPQAAIDAMPPDGAFIYVFEYLDLADSWKSRIPERRGELALGPERAYECMGESRMVTWQEQGRAFQAHVYIGSRASASLERDALSILNSIQLD